MVLKVKIQKIAEVPSPRYEHKGDSGVDLFAAESYLVNPMDRCLVKTGIRLEIPYGYEGQVRPKSGLALHHGISHANSIGTIDSCYRGEIMVPIINFGKEAYSIEKGKKVGQLVFIKVEEAQFEEVSSLGETSRNEKGFGSTGLG